MAFFYSSGYMRRQYTYNANGMVEKIQYKEQGITLREEYDYTYNNRGYISTENKKTEYMIGSKNTENITNLTYTYDAVGRLTKTDENYILKENGTKKKDKDNTSSFTYDNMGNRATMIVDNEGEDKLWYQYDYDDFDRLTEVKLKKGSAKTYTKSEEYSYDDIGRTEWEKNYVKVGSVNKLAKETTYDYLKSGELYSANVSVKDVNGYPDQALSIVDYYLYNADGQRILKESAETIKYYYTGDAVLFTTDINNVKISENIVTRGGEVISSKRFGDVQDGDAWYYFNYDMRGSTTVILKPDGGYKKDYAYDTFGNTIEGGGSFYNETQFTGATYDKSTGMHYMNARYYNPATGRFLTQDSYTGNLYDPWTQNLYSYCMNNPVNYIDPTGHIAAAFAIAGAANIWNPFGWLLLGVAAVVTVVVVVEVVDSISDNTVVESREIKEPAIRDKSNTRKEAEQKAKKAGKGKEPIHHPHGHSGNPKPHFHPDVKQPPYPKPNKMPTPHDHYYYPVEFLLAQRYMKIGGESK